MDEDPELITCWICGSDSGHLAVDDGTDFTCDDCFRAAFERKYPNSAYQGRWKNRDGSL
jgi:hypothetical protein